MNHSSNHAHRFTLMAATAAIIITLSTLLLTGCGKTEGVEHRISNVAHRGGAALAPENTLTAFGVALEHDVDHIEMDIHMSGDGALMVFHDPLLLRLTGEPGALTDYTAEELAQFDVASTFKSGKHYFGKQKMPTLEEVIEFVEENAKKPITYQIEIKVQEDGARYEGIEEKLIDVLNNYAILDRTIVISFDFPTLKSVASLEPTLQVGALISRAYLSSKGVTGPEAVAKDMASLQVDYVGVKQDYLSQALYEQLRKQNLGVGVWTVDDTVNMNKFTKMGVDFITTNRPELLNKVLNRKRTDTTSLPNSSWYL